MALTAARTTSGFEPVYDKVDDDIDNPVLYELTPGVTFNQGDAVVFAAGKVAKATTTAINVIGVMATTIKAVDNPAGKTTFGAVYDDPFNVYRCSFAGHRDATATGGTTTTLVDTALATSTDSVWVGALLYVYDGPGAGCIRTVTAYTGATDTLTVNEPFTDVITNASKYILLGAATGAGDVINIGSVGIKIGATSASIDGGGTVAAEAGPLVVLNISPKDLTMDVMIRKHLFL